MSLQKHAQMIGLLANSLAQFWRVVGIFINHPYFYDTVSLLSLVLVFSMVQKNYKAVATFISLRVNGRDKINLCY